MDIVYLQYLYIHNGVGSDILDKVCLVSGGGLSGSEMSGVTPSTTYIMPNGPSGSQEDLYWGAWCTFCHELDAHSGVSDGADVCNGGHIHGGGNW